MDLALISVYPVLSKQSDYSLMWLSVGVFEWRTGANAYNLKSLYGSKTQVCTGSVWLSGQSLTCFPAHTNELVLGHCSGARVRPDITVMVDWALKINYLSIWRACE